MIEASWAPKDPRDKLYDSDASKQEKTESLFRIIAAFHPVLNLPVVLADLFKLIGWRWFLMAAAVAAGIFAWAIIG